MIDLSNWLSAWRRRRELLCGTLCELQLHDIKAGSVILRRLLCSGMNWLKSLRSPQPTDRNWYTTMFHVINGIEVQTLRREINRVCTVDCCCDRKARGSRVDSWFLMYKHIHVVFCFVFVLFVIHAGLLVHIWSDKLDSALTNFNDNAKWYKIHLAR